MTTYPGTRGGPRRLLDLARTRLLRFLLGGLSVVALISLMAAWAKVTVPFDPDQLAPLDLPATAVPYQPDQPDHPDAIPALTYHAISDTERGDDVLSRRRFTEHLATLARNGYRTVRLADVERLVAGEPVTLPAKPLLLTFDDGMASTWTVVDPVLKRYHFTAVTFLITSRIVEPGTPSAYLSTQQLKRMRDSGRWEFGSRTPDLHRRLPAETARQWTERVNANLARSQDSLTRVLGRPAVAVSYPLGAATGTPEIPEVLPELLGQQGFRLAFAGGQGASGHSDALDPTSSRWRLARLGMRSTTLAGALLTTIRKAVPVAPSADLPAQRWEADHAGCTVTGERAIQVGVMAEGYGACRLAGTNTTRWRDYQVSTRVVGIDRHATAILAVRDGEGAGRPGRLEIALGESSLLTRQQRADGTWETLGSLTLTDRRAGGSQRPAGAAYEVQVEIRGAQLSVRVAGLPQLTSAVAPEIDRGGVRFAMAADGPRTVMFERPVLTAL